jgi:hypothetical protein
MKFKGGGGVSNRCRPGCHLIENQLVLNLVYMQVVFEISISISYYLSKWARLYRSFCHQVYLVPVRHSKKGKTSCANQSANFLEENKVYEKIKK